MLTYKDVFWLSLALAGCLAVAFDQTVSEKTFESLE